MTSSQIIRISRRNLKERLTLILNNWDPGIMDVFDGYYNDGDLYTGCIMQMALETDHYSPARIIPGELGVQARTIQQAFDTRRDPDLIRKQVRNL